MPTIDAGISMQHTMILEIKDLTNAENNKGLSRAEQSRAEQSRAEQSCLIRQATKKGYIEMDLPGVADLEYPNSQTRRGRVIERGKICPTITTENIPNVIEQWIWEVDGELYLIRIRKLTPKECTLLMGFDSEDADKMCAVNSNTQVYKELGNSICVNVLDAIFRQMITEETPKNV